MSENAEDTHGFLKGAEFLVSEVLPVQLDLLQNFLPMDCWVVGRHEGEWFDVVATRGEASGLPSLELIDAIADEWIEPARVGSFRFRVLADRRKPDASAFDPHHDNGYVFRADLSDKEGKRTGVLAGLLRKRGLPACQPAHEPVITLCLTAMGQTLSLHTAMTAADRIMRQTHEHARLDSLTGVLNRTGWDSEISKVIKTHTEVAVGFLDLDCLKLVNDTMGHAAGDKILQLTAEVIKGVIRGRDCVARLGGDEFAVLLIDATLSDATELAGRLALALGEQDIQASIGVATRSEAGSVPAALALADHRMYENKRVKRAQRLASNVTSLVRPLRKDVG